MQQQLKTKAIEPRRAIVLWICAALLGTSAAWARLGANRGDHELLTEEAKRFGFASADDYRLTFQILGKDETPSLSDSELKVLMTYAKDPVSGPIVANILPSLSTEAAAMKSIPLCERVFSAPATYAMRDITREAWSKRGFKAAMAQLDQFGAVAP